jgi:hypothetical protein
LAVTTTVYDVFAVRPLTTHVAGTHVVEFVATTLAPLYTTAVYDEEFATDGNDTVTLVFVCAVTETCGAVRGRSAKENGADVTPTTDVAKFVPSPTDVMVAVNESPVVRPEKVKDPDVFPIIGVVELAVTS